ncbi:hypothetical protein [Rudanella paleaurantiibacter]|nr:hypothetical protein [Rudanella paleaurantiibacter]
MQTQLQPQRLVLVKERIYNLSSDSVQGKQKSGFSCLITIITAQ